MISRKRFFHFTFRIAIVLVVIALTLVANGLSAANAQTNLCASPTTITGGGMFSVTTAGTCFKYVNTSFVRGGMFSVMKDGSSASDTLSWYGGLDQNVTACSSQSRVISGNGGQLNNFTVAKDSAGQMFLTITGSAANSVTISITNWQNGNGCSVAPTLPGTGATIVPTTVPTTIPTTIPTTAPTSTKTNTTIPPTTIPPTATTVNATQVPATATPIPPTSIPLTKTTPIPPTTAPTTPPASGGLTVSIRGNGAETSQQTPFAYAVKNTSTSAKSGISVRIYFNTDNGNAASNYALEKYYDQSGVATIAAPTLASGSTYYFTVNYGTASLAAGAQWEFQTSMHLANWGTNFDGTNDWYHTGYALNALPAAYTNTNYIPAFVSSTLAWGQIPGGSPVPTTAPTNTVAPTSIVPTNTSVPSTVTPVNTAVPTATKTNTPVPTATQVTPPTVTPVVSGPCTSPTDCLSKMTLDEKIGQMTQANKNAILNSADVKTYFLGSVLSGGGEGPNGSGGTASQWADMYDNFQNQALQTRLKIPIMYGVDAVHGHNAVSGAVIFPHHIGMGATRDTGLMEQADAVTRDEVIGTGIDWVFAPCVCVPRDDRWGRTYEGFSEDPTLTSSMGAASIRGFQGAGLSPTTVAATAKHYLGDGGTTFGTGSSGYLIDQGNTQLTETELRAIHLPPYQSAVQNNVATVMASYSSWNGVKMHGNQYLLTTVLKGELGFQGFIVSDWAGIDQISGDYATAVRNSINAGMDMVMVPSKYTTFITTLRNEINAGNIPMSRIDDAVLRILKVKFALGLFNQPLTNRTYTSQVGSAGHRAVARQAVRESLVLLKNNAVLPLSKTASYKLVVGGSHINDLGYQIGGWGTTWQGGSGATTTGTTLLQAIQSTVSGSVTIQNVGTSTGGTYSGDIGIVAIGETPYAEGQGDSSSLALSAANAQQVTDICSRVTKCVVILFSGRPLIINTQLSQAGAFVAAWLPGTEAQGITDVLFGDFGFVGKLPVTWPNAVTQEPINSGDGKTGLFPFGFGISPY